MADTFSSRGSLLNWSFSENDRVKLLSDADAQARQRKRRRSERHRRFPMSNVASQLVLEDSGGRVNIVVLTWN